MARARFTVCWARRESLRQEFPGVEHPVAGSAVAYHMRTGKHDITDYDWDHYIRFADLHLIVEVRIDFVLY